MKISFAHLRFLLILILVNSTMGRINAWTVITCSGGGEVFAAANEDNYYAYSRMWFNPAGKGRYGSVCFGFADMQAQAAMNEHGLFYDFTAQYGITPAERATKPFDGDLFFEILGHCRTVKEALVLINKHGYTFNSPVTIADATGNSVVLNAGVTGTETRNFTVNTNFNIADTFNGKYECRRFDMARKMMTGHHKPTVALLRNVLDVTHQEGKLSTQYSNIYDLRRKKIHVYHFHNFLTPYIFDLRQELSRGYRVVILSNLFPESYSYNEYLKSDIAYRKEKMMEPFNKDNISDAVQLSLGKLPEGVKADSSLSADMLDVSVQLIRDAWNQHTSGGVWPYWFAMENGDQDVQFQDARLPAAESLLARLDQVGTFDTKTKNFIREMSAITRLNQGRRQQALDLYRSLLSTPGELFPITEMRAKRMLSSLNQPE